MSATHPDCMADLERMYDDGPIPPEEKERVRKLERGRQIIEHLGDRVQMRTTTYHDRVLYEVLHRPKVAWEVVWSRRESLGLKGRIERRQYTARQQDQVARDLI